jgi:hypothetical protein
MATLRRPAPHPRTFLPLTARSLSKIEHRLRGFRLVRLFSWWRVGSRELVQGTLRAATAHGGRLMSPEAKFSWLTAAVAVALFGLIVLSLDRITPRDENGAMLAIPQRSS